MAPRRDLFLLCLLSLWALLWPESAGAQTNGTVQVRFTDFQLTAQAGRRVTQTPLQPFADYSGAILSAAPRSLVTDTNGSVAFSNTVFGYAYRYELDTPYSTTIRTSGFPSTLSGTVNARDWLGNIQGMNFFYLYVPNGSNITGTVSNALNAVNATNLYGAGTGTFSGDGSGLTNITQLASTVYARIGSVFELHVTNTGPAFDLKMQAVASPATPLWNFDGSVNVASNVTAGGQFAGSGAGLTNANASNIFNANSGPIPTGLLTAGTTNGAGHLLVVNNGKRYNTFDGSSLTNIAGSNVSLATISNSGTINSTSYVHVAADSIKGNEYGRLPVMGWLSWYGHGTAVTEADARSAADCLRTNMVKWGYNTVILDEGWATNVRSATGDLMAMSNKFTGVTLVPLSDYIHTNSPSLNFGVYLEPGPNALASAGTMPTAYANGTQHYDADLALLASWKVDYIKSDGPAGGFETSVSGVRYFREMFASSAARCGRPMLITSAVTGQVGVQPWMRDMLHSARFFPGFGGTNGTDNANYAEMLVWLDWAVQYRAMFGPFFHPDIDPLDSVTSVSGGIPESRSQMGMAAMLGAPLLLTDPTPNGTHSMWFTNNEVIAVDQDPLCCFAFKTWSNNLTEVWSKPLGRLDSSTRVVALMNRNSSASNITVWFTNAGILPGPATVRDLWVRGDQGYYTNSFTTNVGPHDVALLKITPGLLTPMATGTNYLSDLNWSAPITNSIQLNNQTDLGFGGFPRRDSNYVGNALIINGVTYAKGLGTVAEAEINYWLGGVASSFHASFGMDDALGSGGGLHFVVSTDGTTVFDSGTMTFGTPTVTTNLSMAGVQRLKIRVLTTQGGGIVNNNIGDIANAYFIVPLQGDGSALVNLPSGITNGFTGTAYLANQPLTGNGDSNILTRINSRLDWLRGNSYDVEFAALTSGQIIQSTGAVVTAGNRSVLLDSRSSANGAGAIVCPALTPGMVGDTKDATTIDWSQPFWLGVSFAAYSDGSLSQPTNGFFRVTVGRSSAATKALWASGGEAGIGIEITNNFKLNVLTCNNSLTITRTNTNVTVTHSSFTKHTCILWSIGDGTVNIYYDGTFLGKASGGPTAAANGADYSVIAESANGSNADRDAWYIFSLKTMWGD